MTDAMPTTVNGYMGSGRERRRDQMLPCFCPTTRKRNRAGCVETVSKGERAARIERYRRDVEAGRPIRFIAASATLTRARQQVEAIHGPTA